MTNKPWLRLKSWVFSDWKTVNSVRDSSKFNEYKQVNIFNQPSWYVHIYIKTPTDFVNMLKDVYYYHLYYNSYAEKMEQLEIYKQSIYNLDNKIKFLKKATNIAYPKSRFKRLKIKLWIYFWYVPICNLLEEQIRREINYIEKVYLPEREVFTKRYWDDLLLDYFNFISLDEAQIYFGARSWDKNFSWKNEFLKDFIAYPVKLNCRLEPIVQNPNMLDINFRRQASTYILHTSHLFWLIQKTATIDVKNSESVNFDDAEVLSKSYRLNLYDLFWYPKYQYYRKHLIKPTDPDIYRVWDYFKHIRKMTDKYNIEYPKKIKKPLNSNNLINVIKKDNIQIVT